MKNSSSNVGCVFIYFWGAQKIICGYNFAASLSAFLKKKTWLYLMWNIGIFFSEK